tara:strand:- start:14310 stop:14582 length:273 start_codon:yes stop_codon:yes gene_type:complete
MNNSFQNAINSQKKYHVRIIWNYGTEEILFDTMVRTYLYSISLGLNEDVVKDISYDDIQRIEIHASKFPYKENTPYLYIYLKQTYASNTN